MIPRQGDDYDLRFATLAELGESAEFVVGTRIMVMEDASIYTCAGQTIDEIAQQIGWTQANIWIPEHARQDMLEKHKVISDPTAASSMLLRNPLGVWTLDGNPTYRLFFAGATMFRAAGLLGSRTTRFVDAIIEARPVENGTVLRLFHLSPRKKNYGSIQLWP